MCRIWGLSPFGRATAVECPCQMGARRAAPPENGCSRAHLDGWIYGLLDGAPHPQMKRRSPGPDGGHPPMVAEPVRGGTMRRKTPYDQEEAASQGRTGFICSPCRMAGWAPAPLVWQHRGTPSPDGHREEPPPYGLGPLWNPPRWHMAQKARQHRPSHGFGGLCPPWQAVGTSGAAVRPFMRGANGAPRSTAPPTLWPNRIPARPNRLLGEAPWRKMHPRPVRMEATLQWLRSPSLCDP